MENLIFDDLPHEKYIVDDFSFIKDSLLLTFLIKVLIIETFNIEKLIVDDFSYRKLQVRMLLYSLLFAYLFSFIYKYPKSKSVSRSNAYKERKSNLVLS